MHQFTTIDPWVRIVHRNTDPSVDIVEGYADESRFNGVISLDVSQPTSAGPNYDTLGEDSGSLPYYLSRNALPNLEEINFSNTRFKCSILTHFFQNCRRLERITWNNINYRSSNNFGLYLRLYSDNSLRELTMDNSSFWYSSSNEGDMFPHWGEMEYTEFILYDIMKYCKVLERLSIQNAHYCFIPKRRRMDGGIEQTATCRLPQEIRNGYPNPNRTPLPQAVLIHCIRHAPPSLRWFRSDLTRSNKAMLRTERPGIELV